MKLIFSNIYLGNLGWLNKWFWWIKLSLVMCVVDKPWQVTRIDEDSVFVPPNSVLSRQILWNRMILMMILTVHALRKWADTGLAIERATTGDGDYPCLMVQNQESSPKQQGFVLSNWVYVFYKCFKLMTLQRKLSKLNSSNWNKRRTKMKNIASSHCQ